MGMLRDHAGAERVPAAGETDYWHGRGPLWRVYWLYGVLGSTLLLAALALPAWVHGAGPGYLVIALPVMGAYTVWIVVSVWRCAYNSGNPHWGYMARALTVGWALNVLLVSIFLVLDALFA